MRTAYPKVLNIEGKVHDLITSCVIFFFGGGGGGGKARYLWVLLSLRTACLLHASPVPPGAPRKLARRIASLTLFKHGAE